MQELSFIHKKMCVKKQINTSQIIVIFLPRFFFACSLFKVNPSLFQLHAETVWPEVRPFFQLREKMLSWWFWYFGTLGILAFYIPSFEVTK